MVKIPYKIANGNLSVRVQLKNAANVFLIDELNYRKYNSGKSFKYYGGHCKTNPVIISVNGHGRYYLIVEGSDYQYGFS